MKISLLAVTLAAILAACSSMDQKPSTAASGAPGSSGMTGFDAHMCQQLRGYLGRGEDQRVQEACVRQLGADGCKQCMAGTR